MARAREVSGFDCDEPFSLAAARVVEVRSAELFEHAGKVLDTGDIERLHDMRVATRRLRAALEVVAPCFPAKRNRKALKRVKALAGALGDRRDRDVSIEVLERFAAEGAPQGDQAAIAALVGRLREEQREANEALAPLVAPRRLKKLRRRLRKLAKAARK